MGITVQKCLYVFSAVQCSCDTIFTPFPPDFGLCGGVRQMDIIIHGHKWGIFHKISKKFVTAFKNIEVF
jgi:hypothetical protein